MITVNAFEPLAISTNQLGTFSTAILSYSHEIRALGGYWSATIRLDSHRIDTDEWYENGLGRRIVTYSPENIPAWEGFVNSVRLNLGKRSKTIGPVMDVANYVSTLYTDATSGLQVETTPTQNVISQNRYGILERVLSAGIASTTEAAQYANAFLLENAQPDTSEEITDEPASLVLECLGYVHTLRRWHYINTNAGTSNASVKLAGVLDADPNAILASSNAQIEANTLQVQTYDNNNRTAWNVIKSLVALGKSDSRAVFGVYADRMAVYRSVAQQADYLQSVRDASQQVQNAGGAALAPWYVLPGKWVKATDFLVGRVADTDDLRDDPRFTFIEAVKFTAPYGLALLGGKVDRVDQLVGRMGLRGI